MVLVTAATSNRGVNEKVTFAADQTSREFEDQTYLDSANSLAPGMQYMLTAQDVSPTDDQGIPSTDGSLIGPVATGTGTIEPVTGSLTIYGQNNEPIPTGQDLDPGGVILINSGEPAQKMVVATDPWAVHGAYGLEYARDGDDPRGGPDDGAALGATVSWGSLRMPSGAAVITSGNDPTLDVTASGVSPSQADIPITLFYYSYDTGQSIPLYTVAFTAGQWVIQNGGEDVSAANGNNAPLAGQFVDLTATIEPQCPATQAIVDGSNVTWSMTGATAANFNDDTLAETGGPTMLGPADLGCQPPGATLQFAWVSGGQQTVTAQIADGFAPPPGVAVTAAFNVALPGITVNPTPNEQNSTSGTTTVGVNGINPIMHRRFPRSYWTIGFGYQAPGGAGVTQGITLVATTDDQALLSQFQIGWCQVDAYSESSWTNNGAGEPVSTSTTDELDGEFPISSKNVSPDGLTMWDSPDSPLRSGAGTGQIYDAFDTFLMLKPKGVNGIWVPAAEVDWGWSVSYTISGTVIPATRANMSMISISPSSFTYCQVEPMEGQFPAWWGVSDRFI